MINPRRVTASFRGVPIEGFLDCEALVVEATDALPPLGVSYRTVGSVTMTCAGGTCQRRLTRRQEIRRAATRRRRTRGWS